jgi:hypothetical protein
MVIIGYNHYYHFQTMNADIPENSELTEDNVKMEIGSVNVVLILSDNLNKFKNRSLKAKSKLWHKLIHLTTKGRPRPLSIRD